MLLEFTVGNYRSFYEKRTLSLCAQGLQEEPMSNVIKQGKYSILRSVAVYGANSSGKSNLIKALRQMDHCVLASVKLNPDDKLPYDPFLLNEFGEMEPTFFEVEFLLNDTHYRYGFQYNRDRIVGEWLFVVLNKRSERTLFIRNEEGIGFDENNFPEGLGKVEATEDNRLFISLCAQLKGPVSQQVMAWFQDGINTLSGINNDVYRGYTTFLFHEQKPESKDVMGIFSDLQLGFESVMTHEEKIQFPNDIPDELKRIILDKTEGKNVVVDAVHKKYDKRGNPNGSINFDFEDRESAGTNKMFDLAGPIVDTLQGGKTLIIDELDAKMHPLISQYIIRLFNNPEKNPKNAQLIFTTHDTHLLSAKLLRRDQIWFTEKDGSEQTDLYNMMDVVFPDGTKPRNDSNYEKNYIAGRYGAIPYIK